jgi:fumarate reductase subunit C
MASRRPYVRPMDGWWRRDPFFIRYMAREATAVFVVAYAAILLVTVACLSQGEAAYDARMADLGTGAMIAAFAILVAVFAYHTYTWFAIMPKTMPPIVVAGRKLAPWAITAGGILASIALSLALFAAVRALAA